MYLDVFYYLYNWPFDPTGEFQMFLKCNRSVFTHNDCLLLHSSSFSPAAQIGAPVLLPFEQVQPLSVGVVAALLAQTSYVLC